MLLIYCPYCEEERSELEFRNAGDAHIVRPENIAGISDEEFEEYFFLRDNPKGLIFERWRHMHGCGRFFNAARDTVSDRFYRTYKAGEPKPDISTLLPAAPEPVHEPVAQDNNVQEQRAQEQAHQEEGFAK
ncbi:sarcosine oxidase subunit delta [Rhizobium sp. LEGMi198b]|uniref:sarcosine oxidase subunit delta n=1 Tax=unclassified Rhizobium TaxID=2613769 RepID=UPI000CDF51C4|nr:MULTISPECIES: sarcosine oxidase subunit delta [Rhizobium]AVA22919.1 sarcosine oxidase delta subunit SoxD 2 [Rhizobium sp. NXC24]MDK4738084.1 sarcosine oxidase subunit delta [Rhizobium sp. CNPSo 3464]UWU20292.1 sarcosine oxidase subunit delta [Rhizobium tropici]WFU01109.1 sarcosine oxidase subunit delta [Rhizobium sp. CB3171]